MAVLEMLVGDKAGQRYTLKEDRAILGRHPECTIVLDQGAVSRQHAKIDFVGGEFFVEDLQSRNGTFVNANLVQTPYRLQNGDRLKICDLEFTFYSDEKLIGQTISQPMTDTTFGSPMFWDEGEGHHNSQIMSKLDVSSGATGVRLGVNPEVKLRALIEITQNLSKSLSVDAVLPKLLDSLFKIFIQADRGFVIIKSPDGRLIPKAVKHRREEEDDAIRISRTIVNQVIDTRQAILSADAATDARFDMSQSIADFRIRSMMCAPLVNGDGTPLGVIQLDTMDHRSRFEQDDLDVLAGVASQAAISLDNAQLHEAALRQNQIERDLKLAHKVQQGLLPSAPPKVEGYHFFDFYEAANEVGGDFYDYIVLPNGNVAVVLADVSGKGVSAALVMAKLSADVRYCLVSEPTVAKAVQQINANFSRNGWDDRFVTFVLTLLNPKTHEVTIVNAGHMPPFLRLKEGTVESLAEDIAGVPLGVDETYQYESEVVQLQPGQFVALFTDGFSEAMNDQNELYGLERFKDRVGTPLQNVAQLARVILDDVTSFVAGYPQSDDMCMVCFGRDTPSTITE
ncbi:MAG: SpoIIE family protein phosphatase [Planctomycetota bacterium]|nr:SpoIIE family protein phosphatase [Planctomycetota bacterium]